jgi:hypothetical protein
LPLHVDQDKTCPQEAEVREPKRIWCLDNRCRRCELTGSRRAGHCLWQQIRTPTLYPPVLRVRPQLLVSFLISLNFYSITYRYCVAHHVSTLHTSSPTSTSTTQACTSSSTCAAPPDTCRLRDAFMHRCSVSRRHVFESDSSPPPFATSSTPLPCP